MIGPTTGHPCRLIRRLTTWRHSVFIFGSQAPSKSPLWPFPTLLSVSLRLSRWSEPFAVRSIRWTGRSRKDSQHRAHTKPHTLTTCLFYVQLSNWLFCFSSSVFQLGTRWPLALARSFHCFAGTFAAPSCPCNVECTKREMPCPLQYAHRVASEALQT